VLPNPSEWAVWQTLAPASVAQQAVPAHSQPSSGAQLTWPARHAGEHTPDTHEVVDAFVDEHKFPQPPQLLTSVCSSTHALPHELPLAVVHSVVLAAGWQLWHASTELIAPEL
jgi:hypothetical protein